jgi:hypothetical protein
MIYIGISVKEGWGGVGWGSVDIFNCGSENYLTGHRQTAYFDPQCPEKLAKPGS